MTIVLSGFIGQLWFIIDRKHREITIDNMTRAFGREKNQSEIHDLARKVFSNICLIIFEMGWFVRLNKKEIVKKIKIEGLSNLRAAYEKGKGVLIVTAHLGNWEVGTAALSKTGYPGSIIGRPMDFKPFDKFVSEARKRFEVELIPSVGSMRKVLNNLGQGRIVVVLLDQNVDWYNGVFVDFFGRPACTNKGLALLARKTGAPVVPVFMVRDRSLFRGEIGKEIPLVKTADKIKDIEINTQNYNDIIETYVRRYPEQWFWVHQRWKTRPYQPWPKEQ
ncbi:MAG: lysophospholipid acyltransferase family protein [Desulfobacterales bacterium]|nr:lysophospholipid acyltransferase family protein [Desulfobacteraceae bacterium]MBT4363378.1 lysophospholipid acyltransferase family protein [Desulfobacteraceae bacterium]MBT7086662.1 lysophospholipid acyltransferase family protein [Desulfobacterales bacterium]MBT7697641.1 lysophospholipid acyltransferase family protein [Desulfobacterales bacterium]